MNSLADGSDRDDEYIQKPSKAKGVDFEENAKVRHAFQAALRVEPDQTDLARIQRAIKEVGED